MKVNQLISWSQEQFHHIPWRSHRTLYTTLVSEIMLQQTTVGTVKNHFDRFLKTFPDLKSLALASEEELLIAWKGLGYYRRAKNLKKISERIHEDYAGKFPQKFEELIQIPGIGPYTAQALLSIGLDQPGLALDANLERVISRLFCLKDEKGLKLQKKIQQLFLEKKIFSKVSSYRLLNEALMDLGRTYCQARKTDCQLCPLKSDCESFKTQTQMSFPVEKKLKEKSQEYEIKLVRVYVRKGDEILCYLKEQDEWLSGQWEVPTFLIDSNDPKLKQYPRYTKKLKDESVVLKTGITKYKIENHLILITQAQFKEMNFPRKTSWKNIADDQSNLSTATLKGLVKLKISSGK